MKIAVTYENGQVFQHFGHTEEFKVYDVEDGKVVSSKVLGSDGHGHEELAALLAGRSIDVLICGGIGPGAQAALTENGIELCSGASGDADAAVEAYLKGELVSSGANCDHHDHDHDHCGCGHHAEGKNSGKRVKVHYRGTFNDGSQFDSSYDRGEPLEFVCGAGMMIPGFDAAVAGMEVGEKIDVHLSPAEAYGEQDPAQIFSVAIADLPGAEYAEVGQRVYLQDRMGRPVAVTVAAKDEINITFDANHELAGKELNFTIELLEAE